jgi:predicted ArsR family transcriptional regulator
MSEPWIKWAWAQGAIPTRAKLTLIVLAHEADATGGCLLTLDQIAAITGIGGRSVRDKIKALEARGLIRCQLMPGMRATSRFQLVPSPPAPERGKAVGHA